MTRITLAEAGRQLDTLLDAAQAGEEIIVTRDPKPAVRLMAQPVKPAPTVPNPDWPGFPAPGSCAGLIEVPPDFDAPLDDLKEYME